MNQKTKTRYGQEKGITLIALVITIIVLLILAGVTISMVLGDDGIIAQAQKAKQASEDASTEEKLNIAAVDAKIKGEDYTTIESAADLNEALKAVGLSENAVETTGGYKVSVGEATYKVTTSGTVTNTNIVKSITAENYGDYITGYIDLPEIGGADWQVFLNDGENVWLIASDYVLLDEETLKKTGLLVSEYNSYGTYWEDETIPSKYEDKTFANEKCVAALADEENWASYFDESLATKAMGGPTLEMFVESYNAKYPDGENGIIDYQFVESETSGGYKVRWKKTGDEDWGYGEISGLKYTETNRMYANPFKEDGSTTANRILVCFSCLLVRF